MGRKRKYNTEEERKAANREKQKRYYQKNKDDEQYKADKRERSKRWRDEHPEYNAEWRNNNPEYDADYYQQHKEEKQAYCREYEKTQKGRANNLISTYKHLDRKYNRGECTLTTDWVVKNIFTSSCHYCGETDWHKLGCDRIDNTKPHTPENVVSCCWKCNLKKQKTPYDEYMRLVGKIA